MPSPRVYLPTAESGEEIALMRSLLEEFEEEKPHHDQLEALGLGLAHEMPDPETRYDRKEVL